MLDGGDGLDTASHDYATTAVVASLADPSKNTGDAQGDQYVSIENLDGTPFDDTLEGDGGANRITGRDGKDTLIGNGGDDELWATDVGDDVLYGNDGNDTLRGFEGNDVGYGGAGDDSYYEIPVAIEAPGEGHDTVYTNIKDYILPDNIEDLYLEVTSSARNGYGNDLDNKIVGNARDNLPEGRGGNNTLVSYGGGSRLDGGAGDDTAEYHGSIDKYALTDLGSRIAVDDVFGSDTRGAGCAGRAGRCRGAPGALYGLPTASTLTEWTPCHDTHGWCRLPVAPGCRSRR